MIVVLERGISSADKQALTAFLEAKGFRLKEIQGEEETVIGAVGIHPVDLREVEILPGVARVIPITKPYKLASRELKKEDTCVRVGPIAIGGPRIAVMAGPCSVESRGQVLEIAQCVRDSGAVILRAGAYKPRTSPYSFQGLGEEALKYLKEAGEKTGLPTISEIVTPEHVPMFREYVDILQIGARNMQNFELLKRVGALNKPVVLKRGPAATIQDLLMSAEYLLAHGTDAVILCERGIRTFETYTRYTLDLSAIPVVKKLSHLPIVVDPSHGTGIREKVPPMALAAVAAGADGLIIEVHTHPEQALSDGPQSLYPEQFEKLMRDVEALAVVLSKELDRIPQTSGAKTLRAPAAPGPAPGERTRVSFQGERGAYSENAILRTFPESVETLPCKEFREVFDAVLSGRCHLGMLPLENTLGGSVHQNYDLLLQYPDLKIVGEKTIRIIHSLIVLPEAELKDVRRVFSHPQALSQCTRFLEQHPGWEAVPFYDTAGAVAHIARTGSRENAAIASEEAARVYRMKVARSGIETNVQNYTRFVIVARAEAEKVASPNKASLVFTTPDKPGSLYLALKVLAERRVNMKKLESRPIPGKPWQYQFYVDVEVNEEGAFRETLEALRSETGELRVLGLYRV